VRDGGYLCCEKTDGVRYLFLYFEGACYLIDRKYKIQKVDKMEQLPHVTGIHLLDGELVKDEGDAEPSFLIFDALVLNGKSIMNLNFEH
jgi:hypothetical protein